ncbi:MAG: PIN domain-containing protein [Fimbriimonadales bacterium]|nr:PIN domain-containing protein [Fimbriimonadales bacterium]
MRLLLDTSVLVPVLRGQETLEARLHSLEEAYLCAPVLAELLIGALRSARPDQAVEGVHSLVSRLAQPVLACDEQTARRYAELETALRQQGTPIPPNDVWIAAVALQHDLTLATRDLHYQRIPELEVEMW